LGAEGLIGLRLIWNPQSGYADLGFNNGALDTTQILESMVIVSLFSDRRAAPNDRLPVLQTDPRGWFGDSYSAIPGDQIGSRLWLLEGAVTYPQLPVVAQGYILEALQWMIEDGIAASVAAQCWFDPDNSHQLDCMVQIYEPNATSPITLAYAGIWREAFTS
jgi:phage gp46-like protein